MLNQDALDAAYAAAPAEKRDMNLIASVVRAYEDKVASQVSDARAEVMRLMREEFDPHPSYELPAGEWDDNAEDVADKIVLAVLSESRIHISDAWRVVKKWLADYAEEEATFSRYRDDVMLDGVMTAGERRKLSASLAASPAHAVDGLALIIAYLRKEADRHGQAIRYSGDARSFARTVLKEVALDLEAGEHLPESDQ